MIVGVRQHRARRRILGVLRRVTRAEPARAALVGGDVDVAVLAVDRIGLIGRAANGYRVAARAVVGLHGERVAAGVLVGDRQQHVRRGIFGVRLGVGHAEPGRAGLIGHIVDAAVAIGARDHNCRPANLQRCNVRGSERRHVAGCALDVDGQSGGSVHLRERARVVDCLGGRHDDPLPAAALQRDRSEVGIGLQAVEVQLDIADCVRDGDSEGPGDFAEHARVVGRLSRGQRQSGDVIAQHDRRHRSVDFERVDVGGDIGRRRGEGRVAADVDRGIAALSVQGDQIVGADALELQGSDLQVPIKQCEHGGRWAGGRVGGSGDRLAAEIDLVEGVEAERSLSAQSRIGADFENVVDAVKLESQRIGGRLGEFDSRSAEQFEGSRADGVVELRRRTAEVDRSVVGKGVGDADIVEVVDVYVAHIDERRGLTDERDVRAGAFVDRPVVDEGRHGPDVELPGLPFHFDPAVIGNRRGLGPAERDGARRRIVDPGVGAEDERIRIADDPAADQSVADPRLRAQDDLRGPDLLDLSIRALEIDREVVDGFAAVETDQTVRADIDDAEARPAGAGIGEGAADEYRRPRRREIQRAFVGHVRQRAALERQARRRIGDRNVFQRPGRAQHDRAAEVIDRQRRPRLEAVEGDGTACPCRNRMERRGAVERPRGARLHLEGGEIVEIVGRGSRSLEKQGVGRAVRRTADHGAAQRGARAECQRVGARAVEFHGGVVSADRAKIGDRAAALQLDAIRGAGDRPRIVDRRRRPAAPVIHSDLAADLARREIVERRAALPEHHASPCVAAIRAVGCDGSRICDRTAVIQGHTIGAGAIGLDRAVVDNLRVAVGAHRPCVPASVDGDYACRLVGDVGAAPGPHAVVVQPGSADRS